MLWLLGLFGLLGCGASASHALSVPVVPGYVAGVNPLFPTNSYEAHVRNLLLAGKVTEALGYVKDQTGRVPAWLRSYAAAFDAAKRSVGQCRDVAKAIHGGLSRLGEKPEYLSMRSTWQYVVFNSPEGKQHTLTHTGYHVVVKVGDNVYDAYTGPAGMRLSDYLSRLLIESEHKIELLLVSKP